ATQDGTAQAGSDYVARSDTLVFGPGEISKTLRIPILNDSLVEVAETFQVVLSDATGGPEVGASATVTIDDDDGGRWSDVLSLPPVAIQAPLLPTGNILLWDRLGSSYLWDPATRIIQKAPEPFPDYDTFCSGHTFLPDGRLLVLGGHNDPEGSTAHDGDGVPNASIYDPYTNTWTVLPDMNAGRSYPSA